MNEQDFREYERAIREARAKWPKGPWSAEPDRVEWRHSSGLICLIRRAPISGALCGYVGVPPTHPLYGKDREELDGLLRAHGGISYASRCDGTICHVPKAGESDDVYWIGFDCSHAHDLAPFMLKGSLVDMWRRSSRSHESFFDSWEYRDLTYVRAATELLAIQLASGDFNSSNVDAAPSEES